jgi:hypothetical protein
MPAPGGPRLDGPYSKPAECKAYYSIPLLRSEAFIAGRSGAVADVPCRTASNSWQGAYRGELIEVAHRDNWAAIASRAILISCECKIQKWMSAA